MKEIDHYICKVNDKNGISLKGVVRIIYCSD